MLAADAPSYPDRCPICLVRHWSFYGCEVVPAWHGLRLWERHAERYEMSQTSGTFPALYDRVKKTTPKAKPTKKR